MQNHPLQFLLPIAVNVRIAAIREQGFKANWSTYQQFLKSFQERCAEEPSFSESMLFRTKPGQSKESFNALAQAIAIMAFLPGGVEFAGVRYEVKEETTEPKVSSVLL